MRCVLLALIACAPAGAADLVLRAGFDHDVDHGYDLRLDTPAGAVRSHRFWDDDQRYVGEALWRGRWWEGGLGVTYEGAIDHGRPVETSAQSIVGRAELGLAAPIGPFVRVDALPFAGIGGAAWKTAVEGGDTDRDRALCHQWGAQADVVFALPKLIEIGGGGGWMRQETTFGDLAAVRMRLREDGWFWRVSMAVVF